MLNAVRHAEEAQIVAQAGQAGQDHRGHEHGRPRHGHQAGPRRRRHRRPARDRHRAARVRAASTASSSAARGRQGDPGSAVAFVSPGRRTGRPPRPATDLMAEAAATARPAAKSPVPPRRNSSTWPRAAPSASPSASARACSGPMTGWTNTWASPARRSRFSCRRVLPYGFTIYK